MTTTRTYPYKAWVLMPSFKPVEVEFTKWSGSSLYDGDYTSKGKYYRRSKIFASKADALLAGRAAVDKQAANLAKITEALEKKRAALRKAESA